MRRTASTLLARRLLALGSGLAALYLVLLTGQRAVEAYRVNQEVDAIRREIGALRARNIELQAELSGGRLDEDLERIAREELGLVKPGDQPIVITWPDGLPSTSSQHVSTIDPEPPWRDWLRLFVDVDPR